MHADTDPANVAEQRALTRAGFVREGIARGPSGDAAPGTTGWSFVSCATTSRRSDGDQALTDPEATIGDVGATLPPAGSMVTASSVGRFEPSTLK